MRLIKPWRAEFLFILLSLVGRSLEAQAADVKPLMSKDLVAAAGKETVMLSVVYPPGATETAHRHNAQAFVYVLEGSVVMQLKGQQPVTLKPGDTFYEGPDDVHLVGKNASQTQPARFVVFLVKNKGAPPVLPAQ